MEVHSGFERQPDWRGDERLLIRALRQGDERAFEEMFDRYHGALVHLAMAYVHDRTVAEDVAQDAWLGLLQSLPRFEGRSSLKTWLFRILMNCARANRRREARTVPFSTLGEPWEEDGLVVEPERFLPAEFRWAAQWAVPPDEWPEEHLLDMETTAFLQQAIDHLPPTQRVVLTLRDIEGWASSDVCEALEISEVHQRVLLHRARSHIRDVLETDMRQPTEDSQRTSRA
jgi:RNA polymerase sigma-70 factor (ECF subfamily)